MDAAKNPFSPGAGTQPPELTGRTQNLESARVALHRIMAGRSHRSSLLIGLRGVGKTVLLNKIYKLAEDAGYIVVLIESPEEKKLAELLAPSLRQVLLRLDAGAANREKIHKAMAALRSFASAFKVNIGDIGLGVESAPGTADSGVFDRDLTDLFVSVGEAAKEAGKPVALFIDELQYVDENELGALIAGIHRVGQLNLPLVVFGAGLPQLAGLTGRARSYAERLFDFQQIGPLKQEDAMSAIRDPIRAAGAQIDDDALSELVQITEGYPYFLQEWGLHAWNEAKNNRVTKKDVRAATVSAEVDLDEGFFRVRFDRLTKGEKEYLRAMAELGPGPHRSGDIAEKLNRTVETVAPIRARAIAKGMIYAPSHGDNDFTVPKFDEYMRRVMPELVLHTSKFSERNKRKRSS